MSLLFNRISTTLKSIERNLLSLLWNNSRYPPPGFSLALIDTDHLLDRAEIKSKSFSIKDIIGDGFLWAVPKSRRSIERRLKRKFGATYLMLPKTNLRSCNVCGDDHEVGVLCPTCYKKVMDETKEMQDKIQESLGLEPIEKEVVVVYQGEKDDKPTEYWEGKRIVEMKKVRPNWFSKNLLEQTTQKPATTTDVKPTKLA